MERSSTCPGFLACETTCQISWVTKTVTRPLLSEFSCIALSRTVPLIRKVVVESPTEFQGAVMGSLNQRRGIILGSQDEGAMCVIEAQVPLAEMFGYSTVLRSSTQGKAQFTMEFNSYRQVPRAIADDLMKAAQEEKKNVA